MIKGSELFLNPDNTVYHLHINGDMLADDVILVGAPDRADTISGYFEKVLFHTKNREYNIYTGLFRGKPITVLSTGIGVGNIDIVINELHNAANFDLVNRQKKSQFRHLNLIRLGTCGTMQPDLHIGDCIASKFSIGTDSLAFYYEGSERVRNLELEKEFMTNMNWAVPIYAIENDPKLLSMFDSVAHHAITISSVGFYGPQGRHVELTPWHKGVIDDAMKFRYKDFRIGNFEMEGAPIAFLSSMFGHSAVTVCTVIAERVAGNIKPDYSKIIKSVIEYTLENIAK